MKHKTRKILDRQTYQPRWTIKILDPDPDPDSGTLDPDMDRHQNLTDWPLGHAPPPPKNSIEIRS